MAKITKITIHMEDGTSQDLVIGGNQVSFQQVMGTREEPNPHMVYRVPNGVTASVLVIAPNPLGTHIQELVKVYLDHNINT